MTIDWTSLRRNDAGTCGAVRVTVSSRDKLMADLEDRLTRGQGFSVATLNLDHIVKLRQNPAFAVAYAAQSHVTADGNPIVWLLRLAGERVELTPGSELVEPVAALAARLGIPVGLVGSSEASLDAAGDALSIRHSGLKIVARISPPMGFDPESPAAETLIATLRASGARIVFLAFGAPKQEILAARLQAALPDTGVLSIGAGLDFLSGTQTRAPTLARMLAMEWLWRLLQDPERLWRRYFNCFLILPGLTLGALGRRLTRER